MVETLTTLMTKTGIMTMKTTTANRTMKWDSPGMYSHTLCQIFSTLAWSHGLRPHVHAAFLEIRTVTSVRIRYALIPPMVHDINTFMPLLDKQRITMLFALPVPAQFQLGFVVTPIHAEHADMSAVQRFGSVRHVPMVAEGGLIHLKVYISRIKSL